MVYREPPPTRPDLPEVPPQLPPWPLNLEEQRALMGFAERSASLSAARRAELAGILAGTLGVPAEQAETRLHGIARGLLGGGAAQP
ncbi:hypothetical protein D3C76_1426220 [compost metagenome]